MLELAPNRGLECRHGWQSLQWERCTKTTTVADVYRHVACLRGLAWWVLSTHLPKGEDLYQE